MTRLLPVMIGVFLNCACAGGGKGPATPPIAVNQMGLSERILLASKEAETPAPVSEQAEVHPTKQAEVHPTKQPAASLSPDRDPRRALFEARHDERLRRASEEEVLPEAPPDQ